MLGFAVLVYDLLSWNKITAEHFNQWWIHIWLLQSIHDGACTSIHTWTACLAHSVEMHFFLALKVCYIPTKVTFKGYSVKVILCRVWGGTRTWLSDQNTVIFWQSSIGIIFVPSGYVLKNSESSKEVSQACVVIMCCWLWIHFLVYFAGDCLSSSSSHSLCWG